MTELSNKKWRLLFFVFAAIAYISIFAALCNTTLFDTAGHNDRLFSSDDHYYATEFFSEEIDDSMRIIKHPLLVAFGCLFTKIEVLLLGHISLRHHYQLIVIMQMAASFASLVCLERILECRYKLKIQFVLLACAAYMLAFSVLFYTFVAESYIMSALVLMMTYRYAGEDKPVITVILGILAAGITITNAVLWAIIVFASGSSVRRCIAVLITAGAAFCVCIALLPIRTVFFTSLFKGALGSANNYCSDYPFAEAVVWIFYMLFCSPFFCLDMEPVSPFGDYPGDALSFLPSAGSAVTLIGILWLMLLVYAAVKCRKCPLSWPLLGVIFMNLILHGALQYGLREGFLYCLHHLPAQILLAALLLRPEAGKAANRTAAAVFVLILIAEVFVNYQGYAEIIGFLKG